MSTFERSHSISLFRDPETGLGASLPYSPPTAQKTISGSGFGVAPTIAIAEYFMDYAVGERLTKGNWDSGLYEATDANSYPKIFQLGETRGFGSRDTDGDNGITGFIKLIPDYSSFMQIWQMGVPAGKYFSGASAVDTLPPASNLKMGWHSDQPIDDEKLADIVGLSRNSGSTWITTGNQAGAGLYPNAKFQFGIPNSYISYQKAGASLFEDDATVIVNISDDTGTSTDIKTNTPLFRKIVTLKPTVQDLAIYSVTIDGIYCSFTSSASATLSEVLTGLNADINAKITNGVASNNFNNTATIVTANYGVIVSATSPTANILQTDLRPLFTQYSTHWQGNNNQVNTLHVFPYKFLQVGENCGSVVLLTNAATLAASTRFIPVEYDSWTDTQIQFTPTASQSLGKTHWIRMAGGIPVQSGEL